MGAPNVPVHVNATGGQISHNVGVSSAMPHQSWSSDNGGYNLPPPPLPSYIRTVLGNPVYPQNLHATCIGGVIAHAPLLPWSRQTSSAASHVLTASMPSCSAGRPTRVSSYAISRSLHIWVMG